MLKLLSAVLMLPVDDSLKKDWNASRLLTFGFCTCNTLISYFTTVIIIKLFLKIFTSNHSEFEFNIITVISKFKVDRIIENSPVLLTSWKIGQNMNNLVSTLFMTSSLQLMSSMIQSESKYKRSEKFEWPIMILLKKWYWVYIVLWYNR